MNERASEPGPSPFGCALLPLDVVCVAPCSPASRPLRLPSMEDGAGWTEWSEMPFAVPAFSLPPRSSGVTVINALIPSFPPRGPWSAVAG